MTATHIADRETDVTERPAGTGMPVGPMLRGLGLDLALPVVAYYVLHLFGVGDYVALLVAALVAAARVVVSVVRHRSLNLFATVMLVVFGLSLALTLISGDEHFFLLKNSIVTGAVGLTFLATAFGPRPLTLAAAESFNPRKGADLAEAFRTDPRVRRGHRISSTVWGAGLLAEALIRIPLVYLLPVSVMVGLGEVMFLGAMALLLAWNVWYVRRAQARARQTS
ncbi:hypothetical protein PSU4_49020 [Pseudonocardia sulfidoxydans NBRC 16205]|uniref:Intracellular septation protein A n=1 Tax=Pseudonocardia sulfidoxydans NBRC 16205 TaxID=1223511 RepID=A0A511DSC4_9PSEU|nr:VC0807 family protein [Pseudonocardia sulfidoxydans]GEL25948.1 hypothetical protein PSU4_49020 [Pseudonocardia sulfidoxydans NBRC 16205]